MAIPPFKEIHIENTNSCGYKCIMCPRDEQTRQIGFMPLDDFSLALDRIGAFEGAFHLHGFGEPLLDRKLIAKIQLLKQRSPQSSAQIFSTLGVKVKDDFFKDLAHAGLDHLTVSLYGLTDESYKKIHGFDGLERVKHNLQLLSAAAGTSLKVCIKIPSPHISSSLPIAESENTAWLESLGFEIRHWPYVHNYGDGRKYNPPNAERLCPVINGMRKNILNITWDLDVIPCCYDFNATIAFGNLRESSLEEIFSSHEYFKFVLAHQTNDLSGFPICQNCEKNDY